MGPGSRGCTVGATWQGLGLKSKMGASLIGNSQTSCHFLLLYLSRSTVAKPWPRKKKIECAYWHRSCA